MKHTLEKQENLSIKQAEIVSIGVENGKVVNVETQLGAIYNVRAVILATGTYLKGKIFIGDVSYESGPDGVFPANQLSKCLKNLGIDIVRFKTGTPARMDKRSIDFSKMEDGKYEIADAGFTVSIASLSGKEKSEAAIETHKKFIDIQFPLLGVEKIGWKPGDQLLEESVPYNEEQDIAFYIDKPTAYTKIYPGQFAIYFPEDGHAPGIGQGNIRKVVIKIPVQ